MKLLQACVLFLFLVASAAAQQPYDLLLRGGHVIDPKNKIERDPRRGHPRRQDRRRGSPRSIRPWRSRPSTSRDSYVTPGLVDIHVHVFAGTGERQVVRGRQQRLSRRLHLPLGRDHRGRRRLRRLAQLRGIQGGASSIARGPASSRSSTSSATGCAGRDTSRTSTTCRPSRRPRWRCGTRA